MKYALSVILFVLGFANAAQAATCRASSTEGSRSQDLTLSSSANVGNSFFEHRGLRYEIDVQVQANGIVRISIGDKQKSTLSTSYGTFDLNGTFLGQVEELGTSSGPNVRVECQK